MIDAHQHLLNPDRFDYPWLAHAPQLTGTYGIEQYRAATADCSFQSSIVVEGDVALEQQEAEAHELYATAEISTNRILGVIAACRPQEDSFEDYLARIAHPKLVGLRCVLHVAENEVSQSQYFRHNIALLADYNLCFDLCVRADQLPLAIDLVRVTPNTHFVLDHCGNPPLEQESAMQSWREDIARLSHLHNVSCKVSGLVNHLSGNHHLVEKLRPILEHVAAHFGWDRLLFGGDWPVCLLANTDLQRWTQTAAELLDSQSEETRAAFFSANATRIYGLNGI